MRIYQHKPVERVVRPGYKKLGRCKLVATLVILSLLVTACSGGLNFPQEITSELTGSPDPDLLARCSSTLQQTTSTSSEPVLTAPQGPAQEAASVNSTKALASEAQSSAKTSRPSPSVPLSVANLSTTLEALPGEVRESFSASRSDYLFPPAVKMPDFSRITLNWLGNGYTRVEGAPGEFPVLVVSPNTASLDVTRASSDGSFSAEIAAPPGSWVIVKYDPTGSKLIRESSLEPDSGTHKIRITSAQQAPGSWGMVPIQSPAGEGVPFVISATASFDNYLDFTFCGLMAGDWKPGGSVTFRGLATVYQADKVVNDIADLKLGFHVGLGRLFDANGRGRLPLNNYFSNVLTPTGLPVENTLCCRDNINGARLEVGQFEPDGSSGRFNAPFAISLPIPADVPPGMYAMWLKINRSNAPSGPLGDARGVRSQVLTHNDIAFPPFPIGNPEPPRLIWTLLTDVPSADGSRGTIAIEDAGDFQIANRIATQSHDYVIPRTSKETGEPITYRLEPYIPMVAQGSQDIPNVPPIKIKLPSGSLQVRVTRPDGVVDTMGPVPFAALNSRTPMTEAGLCLDCGGPHLGDVLQLSTASGLFDYQFPDYGEYTIEMTGTVQDVYGNTYEGGGTYKVFVAEPLDLEPATLPMTPLQVGDVLNPGLTVLPGVPADVEVKVTLFVNSDPDQKVEYLVSGRANRFGTFTPNLNAPEIVMTGPGEFLVETSARYTDDNGVLWMGATTWGQVVETPGSPLIAHGRRGRDDTPFNKVKIWFADPLPPPGSGRGRSHANIPYGVGDILWQTGDDTGVVRITAQDTEGLVQEAISAWGKANHDADPRIPSLDARARAGELPLNMFTASGLNPVVFPEKIVSYGYWYGAVERPGERVREIISVDEPNSKSADTYWRFDDSYALQPGVGLEGDRPNDFKFLFGGAVFRDTTRNLNRYGIYGALWVHLPEDDPVGTRVFPPFQGANGGPSGGPIMTLDGEEIDAFVVPLAVRPGTILEVGDIFSFSAHLAPTLPGKVDVKVTGPNGFIRTISGRANAIGYFYDPAQDFEITTPGLYHVEVNATFDSPTSAGAMVAPYPTGTVLGATGQGFDIYVVPKNSPVIPSPHPQWSTFKGVAPVPLLIEKPEGLLSGKVYYTIAMPGFLLEAGQAALNKEGYTTLVYDPVKLSQTFPNIDVECSRISCGKNRDGPRLVDTIWVNVLLEGEDGSFYARQFTLQGPDLYATR